MGQQFEEQPELVAQEPHCFNVAVDFWNKRDLSSLADENTQDALDKITRRINGGSNGKTERYLLWLKAKKELDC